MQIQDLVNQYQSNLSTGGDVSAKTKTKGVEQLVSTISKLQKGQIFEGTVNNIKGNQVTLGLSSGQNISARLDGSISLNIGESVFFQVKSNEENVIQIKPVSIGSMNNPTLLNALSAAGMAVTEENLNMVNTMMKEHMPIDAKSIGEMARAAASMPKADVSTIVVMTKHNLPLTQEMVHQFENYKNNEGQLLREVGELGKSISEFLSSEEVSVEDAIDLQKELVSIATNDETESLISKTQADGLSKLAGSPIPNLKVPNINIPFSANTQAEALKELAQNNAGESAEVKGAEADAAQKEILSENTVKVSEDVVTNPQQIFMPEGGEDSPIMNLSQDSVMELLSDAPEEQIVVKEYEQEEFSFETIGRGLTPKENGDISYVLSKQTSFAQKHPEFFDENGALKPEVPVKELMKQVVEHFSSNPGDVPFAKELFGRDSFGKLMSHLLAQNITVAPEELKEPHKLDDVYKKMDEVMTRVAESASHLSTKSDNPIVSAASAVHENLEFISQVNDLYTYVQIPLQLSGGQATGDLYVFRNKKQQQQNENDEITAFLHFDLEHLGSTDISVRMKNKNVNTKFFLEDDASYNLVMNNIHVLKENLDNLGYTCEIECENDTKPIDFVSDFLERDVKTPENISRYSFDVRA